MNLPSKLSSMAKTSLRRLAGLAFFREARPTWATRRRINATSRFRKALFSEKETTLHPEKVPQGSSTLGRAKGELLLQRRKFITGSAAFGASAILPRFPSIANAVDPQTVVVVGAGIAGLVAAYELLQAGHDVHVFEARMRPGGRIYTLREPFSDGLHAEAGAIDIGDGYSLLMRYLREFDLLLTEEQSLPKQVFYVNRQRYVVAAGQEPDWPYPLTPEEKQLGQAGLWKKYVPAMVQEIGEPTHAGWPAANALHYDRTTLNDMLLRQGVSNAALPLFDMTLNGDDFDHVSALQSLFIEAFEERNTRWRG